MSGTRRVAQAIDALRHGWAIRVSGVDGALDLLPAETAFAEPGLAAPQMLISDARAVTLKLANQRAAAAPQRNYSWWSYRSWWRQKDQGRRLDHAWASPELARQMTSHRVVEETRHWDQPSDHVPLITEFDL